MRQADYVIVGAGAAGPVLAARLSEDPSVDVVLLEAGRQHAEEFGLMQGAFFRLWGGEADWGYRTTAQAALGGRQVWQPRGKVVGGSTALNLGAWMRGVRADYDGWAAAGATGWDFQAALRVFRQVERTDRGPADWRGGTGPIALADMPAPTALSEALLRGFVEAGCGPVGDANGPTPYVADRIQSIFPGGRRRTPADAYLDERVRARPNLTILTEALVTRVLFDGGRASGVVYRREGAERGLTATREVLLCAGTINTAQLLLLSGVGPATHLREVGVPVVADVPGVGENLQDHLYVPIRALAAAGVTGSLPPRLDEAAIAQWRAHGTGPATCFQANGVGFLALTPEAARPDVQLLFGYNADLGDGTLFEGVADSEERTGYTIFTVLLHPRSRGTVRLASDDPETHPILDTGYLTHPDDLATLVRGLRAAAPITRSPALRPYTEQVHPDLDADDAALERFVRAEATTLFHPVGTARMGQLADPLVVTDPQLRVRGVSGLRVVDASVFPHLTSGGPMASTIFVAERAASLIRDGHAPGSRRLPPAPPPARTAPDERRSAPA